MAKKKPVVTNAMRLLKAAKIAYEEIEYEADEVGSDFGVHIAELCCIDPAISFKTLVARGDKTGIMVVCVPVAGEADLKKLAAASGNKKVEMIRVKELLALTGYIRGGVSPIGMKKKYPTYVNSTAVGYDKIVVSGGVCGVSLMLTPSDLQRATGCKFEDITKENNQ